MSAVSEPFVLCLRQVHSHGLKCIDNSVGLHVLSPPAPGKTLKTRRVCLCECESMYVSLWVRVCVHV